jgi:hypothetical protein
MGSKMYKIQILLLLSLLLLFIIIVLLIAFMQGIYKYIPGKNLFAVLQLFCIYIFGTCNVISHMNMFDTFTLIVSKVCVQCPTWPIFVFCIIIITYLLHGAESFLRS